jgi:hypothetical protein
MSTPKTHRLNIVKQGKDKHFHTQMKIVYKAFFKEPQSMKMLSIKYDIDRANICRYCRTLRKSDKIAVAKRSICKITKRIVNFYTTNPEAFPQSNQLKLF